MCRGVADGAGQYEAMPAPLYWIQGNNENFDAIAAGEFPENLHSLPNGQLIEIGISYLLIDRQTLEYRQLPVK